MGVNKLRSDSVAALLEKRTYEEQRNAAAAIAFVVLAESGQIDAVTASERPALFAEWVPGVRYDAGQLRRHGGVLYRCVQAHQSQEGWEPDKTASLWSAASDPAEEWPEWSQPIGAHDAYGAGDKVSHQGKHWVSGLDGNVWEPGVSGWSEVVEMIENAADL